MQLKREKEQQRRKIATKRPETKGGNIEAQKQSQRIAKKSK